jgi:PAS domain S-box-containing protein
MDGMTPATGASSAKSNEFERGHSAVTVIRIARSWTFRCIGRAGAENPQVKSLGQLLRRQRDQIVARFREEVVSLAPSDLGGRELVDHLQDFLTELGIALRGDSLSGAPPEEQALAARHGRQRLRAGFDLRAVVEEYGLLRRTILAVAREQHVPVTLDELETLSDHLITGIAEATHAYVEARQARRDEPFRLLVEGIKDHAIFLLSPQGQVESWNPGAERITGYSAGEVIGQNMDRFFTPEARDAGEPWKSLERARKEGRLEDEGWRVRKDGSRFYANVVLTLLRDDHGEPIGFVKITRDVTERRRSQEQEERLRVTELFVGVLGHDLRNPLTAINAAAQLLLRRDDVPEQANKILARIASSGERMARLIDQLLDFTRVRLGGGLAIMRRRIDVCALVQRVALELELASGRTFRCERHGDVCEGEWDPDRLEQILSNLGHNADRHGQAGTPIVFRCLDDGDFVVLEVHNEGPPIPPELQAVIFDPFRRANRQSPGLGLGLYIVRAIVLAHGGTIDIESSAGHGTSFRVRLPKHG